MRQRGKGLAIRCLMLEAKKINASYPIIHSCLRASLSGCTSSLMSVCAATWRLAYCALVFYSDWLTT